jgi:ABC transporter ATM
MTVQKPEQAKAALMPKDPLLIEDIKSNKEQRKVDWAIMKEMAKYLWPKVHRLSLSSNADV